MWIMQMDLKPLINISIYNIILTQDIGSIEYRFLFHLMW